MLSPKICYYLFGLRIPLFLALTILLFLFRKRIQKIFRNKFLPYLIVSLPPLVFFVRIIMNDPFFLSDDFDHILLSFKEGYWQILARAISPGGIWVGHRIITGFWLFKFIYGIFGANIYPFVIAEFLLHLINVILLYIFIKQFVKNKVLPVFFTFIFGFFYLNWISNLHELLGALFVLLTLIFAVKRLDLEKDNNKYSLISIGSYFFALFSKEITFLIFPVIFLIYLYKRKLDRKNFRYLAVLFILFITYAVFFASGFLRYFGYKSGYSMGFNLADIFSNLTYYLKIFFTGSITSDLVFVALIILGVTVSFRKSGWLAFIFFAGFIFLILPSLLFIGRTAPYYIYTPGLLLFSAFSKLFEDMFGSFKNYYLKTLMLIFFVTFVFGVDIKLRDECFLISSPWSSAKRADFMSLIAEIKKYEDNPGKEKVKVFDVTEVDKNILGQYLNEGTSTDLIRAFLYPMGGGFNYSYNSGKGILTVQRE